MLTFPAGSVSRYLTCAHVQPTAKSGDARGDSRVLSQSSIFGQNPKIGCQEFNDLQSPKRSKKQLCDRTGGMHRLFGACGSGDGPAHHNDSCGTRSSLDAEGQAGASLVGQTSALCVSLSTRA